MSDWCDTLGADDTAGLFDTPIIHSDAKLPFQYGRDWPHAGSWIDPSTRTVHLED